MFDIADKLSRSFPTEHLNRGWSNELTRLRSKNSPKEIKMMKSTSAIALASALLFSTAAFAQSVNNGTAPNTATTPDGVTPTPDATNTRPKSDSMKSGTHHKKHKKSHSSSRSSQSGSDMGTNSKPQGSTMQTTPDGVTPTPDATVPAK
ncbi:MAG TPA: hypothetical protein VN361_04240 [Oxalicibacterium sp.]|nr:hypothetical protein [Oxalicibacterium sp.]